MQFREAAPADIAQIQRVRNSVKENRLSDPSLVPDKDVLHYITQRGKGWVCEEQGTVVGFAIADITGHNIWALFLLPEYEGKGIGRGLHQRMMDWYFLQTEETVWLSTAPRSRAEMFYRKAGWAETGLYGKGEIKFEMTKQAWQEQNSKSPAP